MRLININIANSLDDSLRVCSVISAESASELRDSEISDEVLLMYSGITLNEGEFIHSVTDADVYILAFDEDEYMTAESISNKLKNRFDTVKTGI